MNDQNKLHSFYYTFGTSESFPYQKGWVVVKAKDRVQADELFRSKFPDRTPGILNCSSVYPESLFDSKKNTWPEHWRICHETIVPERTAEDIYESLCEDSHTGTVDISTAITMFLLNKGLGDPMPKSDLLELARKVNAIPSNSEHAYASEETIEAVKTLCRTGLDFSKLSSQDPFYNILSSRVDRSFTPEETRHALLHMSDTAFAQLICDFAEKNRNDLFSGHNRGEVNMSEVASEWVKALRSATNAMSKEIKSLSDTLRDAESRVNAQQVPEHTSKKIGR